MSAHYNDLLDQDVERKEVKRRDLLPGWIKFFIWVFFICSVLLLFFYCMSFFGLNFYFDLYGIEENINIAYMPHFVNLLFLLKGFVALSLWQGKPWAVKLALLDGFLGLICCIIVTWMAARAGELIFRLEFLVLIPYLMKMYLIQDDWAKAAPNSTW